MTRLRHLLLLAVLLPPTAVGAGDSAGMQDIGNHVVHYNALPAAQIDSELATRHELPRTAGHAIVTIAVMTRDTGEAVGADIRAYATDDSGRMHHFSLREVRDGNALFYVGSLPLGDAPGTLEFSLQVRPERASAPQAVRFTRRFGSN